MKAGADDKFRAGIDGGLSFGSSSYGSGAEQKTGAVFLLELFEYVDRAGNRHGDFDNGDPARDHGLNNRMRLSGVASAQDGNETYAFDDLCCGLRHFSSDCIDKDVEVCMASAGLVGIVR